MDKATFRIWRGEGDQGGFEEFDVELEEGTGAYRMEIMARKSARYRSAAQFTIWP